VEPELLGPEEEPETILISWPEDATLAASAIEAVAGNHVELAVEGGYSAQTEDVTSLSAQAVEEEEACTAAGQESEERIAVRTAELAATTDEDQGTMQLLHAVDEEALAIQQYPCEAVISPPEATEEPEEPEAAAQVQVLEELAAVGQSDIVAEINEDIESSAQLQPEMVEEVPAIDQPEAVATLLGSNAEIQAVSQIQGDEELPTSYQPEPEQLQVVEPQALQEPLMIGHKQLWGVSAAIEDLQSAQPPGATVAAEHDGASAEHDVQMPSLALCGQGFGLRIEEVSDVELGDPSLVSSTTMQARDYSYLCRCMALHSVSPRRKFCHICLLIRVVPRVCALPCNTCHTG
jgi:hypothetical protein